MHLQFWCERREIIGQHFGRSQTQQRLVQLQAFAQPRVQLPDAVNQISLDGGQICNVMLKPVNCFGVGKSMQPLQSLRIVL